LDFVPGCFTEKNGWREKQFWRSLFKKSCRLL
jgi:hypothetical protein